MIDSHRLRHGLLFSQAMILFLVLLPHTGRAGTYDDLVAMMRSSASSTQIKAKTTIAFSIKKSVLGMDPNRFTEDTFLFGHFINPDTPDLAVGISIPPRRGNLVILTKIDGRYLPIAPVRGIGFIESIESINLFSGPSEQVVLNLFGGGSGKQHWGKDIYCWDGTKMRMIWAWVRKDIDVKWPPESKGTVGRVVRSEVSIIRPGDNGPKEIHTMSVVDVGVFSHQKGHKSELEKVTSHIERREVHRWDDSLFFYVANHGEILPTEITVRCWKGIPQSEGSETLNRGMRIGILDIPGVHHASDEAYHCIIGKEHFCEIPKSAVHIVDEGK